MNYRALLLTLVAALCGTVGFLAYQHWMRPTGSVVAVAPAPAPPATPDSQAEATPTAPVVANTVPNLKFKDLNGKQHSLAEYRGAPAIYNFWATWCVPCRREIPLLNKLYADHRAEKLQILGVAIDFSADVQKFLAATPISYTVLMASQDGAEVISGFGMELVLPFSVFADPQGQIVAVKVGELHANEANAILSAVQALQTGRLTLATARQQITKQMRQFSIERAASGSQK